MSERRHPNGLPVFSDGFADDDTSDFRVSTGYRDLPGQTPESGNMFQHQVLWMTNLNMEDAIFTDKTWQWEGHDTLEFKHLDPVMRRLFYSDAILRHHAIEQLTLPPEYTTIPNTGAFPRVEHLFGSVLLVQKIGERYGISGRQLTTLMLRTMLSDVGHTFGSHLGDWMFQGVGGAENQHDIELMSYLEAVGVGDILRAEGYEPDDVVFPDIEDWVEASQPDLCVDRVDYGLREMNRWNSPVRRQMFSSQDFVLTPEGMMAMADQRRARIFSEGFLLLSQEHWSEATHRLLLDLLMLRTKLFYGEGRSPHVWAMNPVMDSGGALIDLDTIHPRDLMYVTDPAQTNTYKLPHLGGNVIDSMMSSIARYRRQLVWPGRSYRINSYMDQFIDGYDDIMRTGQHAHFDDPQFGHYKEQYPATHPLGVAILDADEAAVTASDFFIDIPQSPFKTRQIDPLVQVRGGFRRLSELDPSYGVRLQEHKDGLARPKVARLAVPNPDTREMMQLIINNVDSAWQGRLQSSRRMTPDELRELIKVGSMYGHDSEYPFIGYLAY